jgi:hypothetical protein
VQTNKNILVPTCLRFLEFQRGGWGDRRRCGGERRWWGGGERRGGEDVIMGGGRGGEEGKEVLSSKLFENYTVQTVYLILPCIGRMPEMLLYREKNSAKVFMLAGW